MVTIDELRAALERVARQEGTAGDLQLLRQALARGEITAATGERAVVIGGDASDLVIITGTGNVLNIFKGVDAYTLRGALGVSAFSYWSGRPASLEASFFGRERELATLAEAFNHHRVVVVSGGAGTGKSRLAAEYSHQTKGEGFWITVGTTLVQTLVALAPNLGVPLSEGKDAEVAEQVQRRLGQFTQDEQEALLWVVDNVGDLNLVNDLSAAAGFLCLLVTTRDHRRQLLPPSIAFVELQPLDIDPAVALLCSRRQSSSLDPQDPLLKELAEAVGRLPLALEMLAVRLGENWQTPQRIIDQLRQASNPVQMEVFQQAAGASIPRADGVFATISGTLETLSPEVREQISPLGYVANVPIPKELFVALTELDEEELERLMRECSHQSVLSWMDNQVVIHALTAAALQATNDEDALPLETTFSRAWNRLYSISLDNPIALRLEIAHYEQILEYGSKGWGSENTNVLNLSKNLAGGYRALGRYQEAVELDKETLAIMERVLGPEHPDTLRSRNNLAGGYRALGRYQEAVELDKETLAIRERVLGPEHPDTLRSRGSLASGYRDLGRYQEAVELDKETLAIRERVLGLEHPDTLHSRNNLAIGYRDLGRYQEAVKLYEETLAIRERVLGPEHPDTLHSRNNLAIGYRDLGRHQEAVELDKETLAIRERVLGPEHPDTLRSRNNLASGYFKLGRHRDAVQLYGDKPWLVFHSIFHPKGKPRNEKRGWIRGFLGTLFRP
jgi:tetratricopeptide (TPR) repeat protein